MSVQGDHRAFADIEFKHQPGWKPKHARPGIFRRLVVAVLIPVALAVGLLEVAR